MGGGGGAQWVSRSYTHTASPTHRQMLRELSPRCVRAGICRVEKTSHRTRQREYYQGTAFLQLHRKFHRLPAATNLPEPYRPQRAERSSATLHGKRRRKRAESKGDDLSHQLIGVIYPFPDDTNPQLAGEGNIWPKAIKSTEPSRASKQNVRDIETFGRTWREREDHPPRDGEHKTQKPGTREKKKGQAQHTSPRARLDREKDSDHLTGVRFFSLLFSRPAIAFFSFSRLIGGGRATSCFSLAIIKTRVADHRTATEKILGCRIRVTFTVVMKLLWFSERITSEIPHSSRREKGLSSVDHSFPTFLFSGPRRTDTPPTPPQ